MAENELAVEVREGTGKGPARRLRAAGRIPAVCYGRGATSLGISLDPSALNRLLKASTAGMNTLIELQIEGGGEYHGKPMLVKELQRDPVSGRILHADLYAVNLQETIQVSVRDDGIGIDPAHHAAIFEIFQRAPGVDAPGSGVGLALCKRIVERHGGCIAVASAPGQGACFTFTLPAA